MRSVGRTGQHRSLAGEEVGMGTGCFVPFGLAGGGLSPRASPPMEPKECGIFMEALDGRKGGRARLGCEQSGGQSHQPGHHTDS